MRRAATPADAATLAAHRYPGESGEHLAAYAAWVRGALADGRYLGWLHEEGGAVVAGAGLILLDWGPTRQDASRLRGRVVNVWTRPDRRRQGLARALVQACLESARQRGVQTVGLGTTSEARPLYLSLGFQAVGTELLWRARDERS